MNDDNEDEDSESCEQCAEGMLDEDGRCSEADCPSYEKIDTDYTRDMICPWCQHSLRDIFEIDGAYEDGNEIEVDCPSCERQFTSVCTVSYSFATERTTEKAKARKQAADETRSRKRREIVTSIPEGTQVLNTMTGQRGVVVPSHYPNSEFVGVVYDNTPRPLHEHVDVHDEWALDVKMGPDGVLLVQRGIGYGSVDR